MKTFMTIICRLSWFMSGFLVSCSILGYIINYPDTWKLMIIATLCLLAGITIDAELI